MAIFSPSSWFNRGAQEKALSSPDDRGWTRIFDWTPGAWQSNTPYEDGENSLTHPTVFACTTLIAGDTAKLRLGIRKKVSGIWEEAEHPALKLLRKPNNYQTTIQFITQWVLSKKNFGNTYVYKVRDAMGDVVQMHILDPVKVKVLISEVGDVYYTVNRDHLAGLTADNTYPARDIIHDRENCLYHPLVGMSPIYAAFASTSMGLEIINNSKDFFANGANPGGMLSAPGSITEETAKRLKKKMEEGYSGKNSGKILVGGDGLVYHGMRMNSTDAQLLEQLKWSDEKICSCYHVPAHKVGVGQMPTLNNIEALNLQYYTDCLQILIESLESCLDDGLGIGDGYRAQFDVDSMMRMDQKTLMETVAVGIKGTILSPDEGRKKVGYGPTEGGKNVLSQQQNYSLAALAERDADKPFSKPTPSAPAVEPVESEPDEMDADDAAKYFAYKLKEALL